MIRQRLCCHPWLDALRSFVDHPRMHACWSVEWKMKKNFTFSFSFGFRKFVEIVSNKTKPIPMIVRTLVLICFAVSVKNTAEFVSLADIFVLAPCSAGKNVEWMRAGFGKPRRGATSLVIRKYGSWSMAHGIKQCTFLLPKMNGNEDENDGAAWTAGNAIFPIGSESPKPKIPFTWLNVTHFWMRIIFW